MINAIHDLTFGVFVHMDITPSLEFYLRTKYTGKILSN